MADILQTKSLSVLEGVEQNLRTLKEMVSFIKNLTKPQDIIDKSNEIIKSLDELDMSFSIIATDLNQLRVIRGETLSQYRSIQSDFMVRINARREKQIQLNSNVELYNSERLMKDISYSPDNNMTLVIQEITKPEEYSILNIINRIEKTEPLILGSTFDYMAMRETSNRFMDKIPVVKAFILSLKSLFGSVEFIQLMSTEIYTTECKDYMCRVVEKIKTVVKWMEYVRDYTKTMFRVFVAMKENYEIYSEAVEKFSSIALESLFNPTSYYEVL